MVRPTARRNPLWTGAVVVALLAYAAPPLLPAGTDVCHELHHAFEHLASLGHDHRHDSDDDDREDSARQFEHVHARGGEQHGHSDLVDLMLTARSTDDDELSEPHAVQPDISLNCHLPCSPLAAALGGSTQPARTPAVGSYHPDGWQPPPDPPPKA